MQFRVASFFAIIAAVGVSAQQLQINTPTNVVQCLPQLITWSGGTPPYFVSVLPGGQPSAAALVDFGQQNGTSLTWVVNEPAGTSLGLNCRDSTGTVAQSAPFTVASSSDTSCLSSSLSVVPGSSTAGGATTSAGSASTTGASGTTTGTGAASTRTSSASGSATSSHSSATSSSAAMPFADIGSAGIIGALVVALFA